MVLTRKGSYALLQFRSFLFENAMKLYFLGNSLIKKHIKPIADILVFVFFICIIPAPCLAKFSFAVLSDQRQFSGPGTYNNPNYFLGAVTALEKLGAGAFMISAGDIDHLKIPNDSITLILQTNDKRIVQ